MRSLSFSSRAWAPAVAVLVVLAGCSGGGGGATSLGPVPTGPSTTVEETTTTTVPVTTSTTTTGRATTSTTAGRATTTVVGAATTTTAAPRLVDGIPQVTATPARAAIGSRVRIEGTGFTDERWRSGGPLWLTRTGSCALYAEAEHTITVSASGRLTGDFVVPSSGNCRMDSMDAPVTAGSYRLAFACTACFIGQVEVTSSARSCANVGFTPNSDDVASSIVAVNMTCADAEALVRKVGAQVSAVGGPARVTADGFTCVRTKQDDGAVGLASATFECTSGARTVSFVRT